MTGTKHINLGDTAFCFAHSFRGLFGWRNMVGANKPLVIRTPRVLFPCRAECFPHNIRSLCKIILTDARACDSVLLHFVIIRL
ncbi:hypothetical protein C8R48DRAFT_709333 [Suillus tomentosus]|nr:hypothetical protein C8R48DRAFT_709333 [Suillus tomentosus]